MLKMLERSGAEASRPDGLSKSFGLVEDKYHLSDAQAQAILEMRLHQLTGLAMDDVKSEYADVMEKMKASPEGRFPNWPFL